MADKPSEQRKNFYVSRVIQGRILWRFFIFWCAYHVVLWHAMFFYRYMQYRGELLAGAPAQSFAELYSAFVFKHYSVIICALAVLPLFVWDALRVTHRVAGPLVRFQRALERLGAGERIEKITLRKGDLLTEFQDCFNRYLEQTGQLADRNAKERGEGSSTAGSDASAAAADECELLRDNLREIERSLAAARPIADDAAAPSEPVAAGSGRDEPAAV